MASASQKRKLKPNRIPPAGLVLIFMGLAVAIVEITVHILDRGINSLFLQEMAVYVLLLPGLGLLVLYFLEKSERERARAVDDLNQFVSVIHQLGGTTDFGELVDQVLQFPRAIFPVGSTILYLYNADFDAYEETASWLDPHAGSQAGWMVSQLPVCSACRLAQVTGFHPLPEAPEQSPDGIQLPYRRYCLPLSLAGHPVGLLHLDLPAQTIPSEAKVRTLNNIAPEVALALDRARLNLSARSQAAIAEAERRHIAQDLHDTLGQNIAYLRLKLDQLTYEENPLLEIHKIQEELERMHTIAEEAYQQVRETLADLHPENSKDFSLVVLEQTRTIAERSQIQIDFNQEGAPIPLQPHVKRQLLYICREALANVEKHAGAQHAQVYLNWCPETLVIHIQDDGQGFIPEEVDALNHFGLTIMHERADSISARMKVDSKPEGGTEVSVEVPLYTNGVPASRAAAQDITLPIFTRRHKNVHENPHR